jgi:hypothetical protein
MRAVCRGTEAERNVEKAKRFEAVPLLFDKYQALNGTSPVFMAGTETLQAY